LAAELRSNPVLRHHSIKFEGEKRTVKNAELLSAGKMKSGFEPLTFAFACNALTEVSPYYVTSNEIQEQKAS